MEIIPISGDTEEYRHVPLDDKYLCGLRTYQGRQVYIKSMPRGDIYMTQLELAIHDPVGWSTQAQRHKLSLFILQKLFLTHIDLHPQFADAWLAKFPSDYEFSFKIGYIRRWLFNPDAMPRLRLIPKPFMNQIGRCIVDRRQEDWIRPPWIRRRWRCIEHPNGSRAMWGAWVKGWKASAAGAVPRSPYDTSVVPVGGGRYTCTYTRAFDRHWMDGYDAYKKTGGDEKKLAGGKADWRS